MTSPYGPPGRNEPQTWGQQDPSQPTSYPAAYPNPYGAGLGESTPQPRESGDGSDSSPDFPADEDEPRGRTGLVWGIVVASVVIIAGFVVPPGSAKRVLIRGVGPGLTPFGVTGVLAQPTLQLLSGTTVVAQNTNWSTSVDAAAITSGSLQVGAFGLANNDSALVVTLAPGNYTAQVSGANNTTGVALIEVYELP